MSTLHALALLGSIVGPAAAHGTVQGIVAGGKWYQGYSPSFQFQSPPPVVIGWSVPDDLDNGFVDPNNYTTQNIICHKSATPAGASAPIEAGSIVELQWTPWPDSHHGPVLDYLAKCPGKCEDVDKTTLEFFKIDQGGLINDASPPGTWASDQLIANNNSWTVTIPKSIAPGNYVLRHEIIALHSAGNADGAQNYPQCINLEISGSGTETPAGTLGEKLYKADDPGILINIYQSLSTYVIPGPTLIADAVSMKQTEIPFSGVGKVVTAPTGSGSAPATSSAAATSAAPTSASASAPAASSQTGAASYSAPAASSSASAVSSSAVASSSAGAVSSSAAPVPSSSSASCTYTITLSSSAIASTGLPSGGFSSLPGSLSSAPYGNASSVSVAPVSASSASISASASAPAGYPTPVSSVAPTSSSAVVAPATTSAAAPPTPSSTKPKPPSPPSPPSKSEMQALLAKLIKLIKQLFRSAEHGRDFKGA